MPRKWLVFAAVACGTFMATLDASIVNIAISTLTRDLTSDLSHIKWVVVVYFLIITCLLLPIGRISDQLGAKNVFGFGFIVFTTGSVLCGFAQHLPLLIFFRVIQATGAAMLMANGPAIITANFPARERGAALGYLAMIVSIGLISGPSVGGVLIKSLGWRSIFWVNFPIGLMGIFFTYKYIQNDAALSRKPMGKFDWPGAILQSIVLVCIIFIFDPPELAFLARRPFLFSRSLLALLAISLGYIFVKWEKKVEFPVFDLSLLENRTFWTANLAAFMMMTAYSSVAVMMPYYLEQVLLYGTDTAGLLMTAIPFIIFIIAPMSGKLSDVLGSKELCIAGSFIESLTLLALGGLIGPGIHAGSRESILALGLCATGLGIALFQSPNNNAIMGAVPRHKLGAASAMIATVRNLGLFVGAGLATGSFSWKFQRSHDFIQSLHFTFLIAGVIGLMALAASFGKSRGPSWK